MAIPIRGPAQADTNYSFVNQAKEALKFRGAWLNGPRILRMCAHDAAIGTAIGVWCNIFMSHFETIQICTPSPDVFVFRNNSRVVTPLEILSPQENLLLLPM